MKWLKWAALCIFTLFFVVPTFYIILDLSQNDSFLWTPHASTRFLSQVSDAVRRIIGDIRSNVQNQQDHIISPVNLALRDARGNAIYGTSEIIEKKLIF